MGADGTYFCPVYLLSLSKELSMSLALVQLTLLALSCHYPGGRASCCITLMGLYPSSTGHHSFPLMV